MKSWTGYSLSGAVVLSALAIAMIYFGFPTSLWRALLPSVGAFLCAEYVLLSSSKKPLRMTARFTQISMIALMAYNLTWSIFVLAEFVIG